MLVHAVVLFSVAWMVRAAASAPVVASAFHPSLAPVGVLLAVLGYALGTYCAYVVGIVLRGMAGG